MSFTSAFLAFVIRSLIPSHRPTTALSSVLCARTRDAPEFPRAFTNLRHGDIAALENCVPESRRSDCSGNVNSSDVAHAVGPLQRSRRIRELPAEAEGPITEIPERGRAMPGLVSATPSVPPASSQVQQSYGSETLHSLYKLESHSAPPATALRQPKANRRPRWLQLSAVEDVIYRAHKSPA